MSVIATFGVSAESFPLGSCIENQSAAKIEIERIVPMRQQTFPFIFVWDHTDFEQFEQTIHAIPEVEVIEELETFEDGRLYKLDWAADCPLITELIDNEGTILSAEGDTTMWRFELRFPSHPDVSQFFQDVTTESEIEIHLSSLVNEVAYQSGEELLLTDKQRAALETAIEMGYFEVPRTAHLDDIATELGISPSSASALLRRGARQFLSFHLRV